MRILLVAPQPFFEERGTPIAVRWVVETLCGAGHSVDLLCYHCGHSIDVEGLQIIRAWGPAGIKHIPIGFSWQKLVCDLFLTWKLFALVFRTKYDVIHAVEEAVFPAKLARRIHKSRLIYDMDSSMVDQLIEKWAFLSKISGLLTGFEKRAVKSADLVLPVCDSLKDKVQAFHTGTRICVLHDRAMEAGSDDGDECLREELEIHGKMLMYVGNLEFYQGMDLLLDSLAGMKDFPEWYLVVIGGKEKDIQHCRDKAKQDGLEKQVSFLGLRPISLLQYYLEQADILISPRIKGVNTPLKIYSYMLAGKPVIATAIQSHTQVLDETCACLVEPEPARWAEAIRSLLTDVARAKNLGKEAKKRALLHHTREAYENTLLSAYTFDLFVHIEGKHEPAE